VTKYDQGFRFDLLFNVTEVIWVHLGQVANNPPTSIQTMSAEHQALGPLVCPVCISRLKPLGLGWRSTLLLIIWHRDVLLSCQHLQLHESYVDCG
jgi:hypothetical protein